MKVVKNIRQKLIANARKSAIRIFILVMFQLLYSCNSLIEKDIPLNKKGKPFLSYSYKNQIVQDLKLDRLENGFDSLQIRLWYSYSFKDTAQLIVIKKHDYKWKAELITFIYYIESDDKNLLRGEIINRISNKPKSDWNSFTKHLLDKGIMAIPDMHKLPDYPLIADGDGVAVEVADRKKYRYYSYQEPETVRKDIIQANRIEEIIEFIEEELDFVRIRKFLKTEFRLFQNKKLRLPAASCKHTLFLSKLIARLFLS